MYIKEPLNRRIVIIYTLLNIIRESDMETFKHCIRLEKYCILLGKKLKLSTVELAVLSDFAKLHDIGKLGISQSILNKPGSLSNEEWEQVRRHPEFGYHITKEIPELVNIATLILLHHERWDGKGYPKALKGMEIPLFCRILAVVDAFDVMTHGRVYKKPCSVEDAIAELNKNSGTQFDPKVIATFIDVARDTNIL